MIVNHVAIVQGWNTNEEVFQNAQTLILGSFNPNKPEGNTDNLRGIWIESVNLIQDYKVPINMTNF